MISQICESGDEPEDTDDALAAADRRLSEIETRRLAIAERRRALAEPTHKLVVASPSGMHHKITLGAVIVNAGFQASDADALAGLLSADPADFAERFQSTVIERPYETIGQVIADILDINQRQLAARGHFLAWQKRMAVYLADRAEWLARDKDFRLNGEWRTREMTADQRWLVRATCRVLKIGLPGHLLRGEAADWLEAHGANLNYGEFM